MPNLPAYQMPMGQLDQARAAAGAAGSIPASVPSAPQGAPAAPAAGGLAQAQAKARESLQAAASMRGKAGGSVMPNPVEVQRQPAPPAAGSPAAAAAPAQAAQPGAGTGGGLAQRAPMGAAPAAEAARVRQQMAQRMSDMAGQFEAQGMSREGVMRELGKAEPGLQAEAQQMMQGRR